MKRDKNDEKKASGKGFNDLAAEEGHSGPAAVASALAKITGQDSASSKPGNPGQERTR
jgi:hypothetical protein